MKFLFPSFLYALFAIMIPIIIHYFNFRKYKTVYFSDIQLLQNIKQESQSRNKLRHWLLLITRILFIAALVFAFAKPYIPVDSENRTGTENLVSVYVDNSFSMEGEAASGNMLGIAKNKAIEIAEAYPSNTKYMLISNDYPPHLNYSLGKEQFINQVSKLDISSKSRKVSTVYERQADMMNGAEIADKISYNKEIYWISDAQQSTTDLENIDSVRYPIRFITLQSQNLGNIFIDSCWFASPARIYNKPERLMVSITNNSENSYSNFPVKLYLNDSVKSLASATLNPNSSATIEMVYTNNTDGIIKGRIEINDYPITFDNNLYFNYIVRKKSKILVVQTDQKTPYLKALFDEDDYFTVDYGNIKSLDYSNFAQYQVIILEGIPDLSTGFIQQLKKYINTGGTCIVFPGSKISVSSYNMFLENFEMGSITGIDSVRKRANRVLFEDAIYADVFSSVSDEISYPVLFKHYLIEQHSRSSSRKIIANDTGDPVLLASLQTNGRIFFFSFALDPEFTDFPENPLFVPTVYNIALFNQHDFQLYFQIGKEGTALVNTLSNLQEIYTIKLVNTDLKYESVADVKSSDFDKSIEIPGSIHQAGIYDAMVHNEAENALSFNYARDESILDFYNPVLLKEAISKNQLSGIEILSDAEKNLTNTIRDINQGRQLWKIFLWIALALLALEIFVIRILYRS